MNLLTTVLRWLESDKPHLRAKAQEELEEAVKRSYGKESDFGEERQVALRSLERCIDSNRNDTICCSHLSYKSFDAPAAWDAPYAIQHVTFRAAEPEKYPYHVGEELIIPLSGAIRFSVLSPRADNPLRFRLDNSKLLRPGAIHRLNCQLPHNAWSEAPGGGDSTALIVFRDLRGKSGSITRDAWKEKLKEQRDLGPSPRRIFGADILGKLGPEADYHPAFHLAPVLWGLGQRLRLHREMLGLTQKAVAAAHRRFEEKGHIGTPNVDSAWISRVEGDRGALRTSDLVSLSRILDIRPESLLSPPDWTWQAQALDQAAPLLAPPDAAREPHFLHGRVLSLKRGEQQELGTREQGVDLRRFVCGQYFRALIVTTGRVDVQVDSASCLSEQQQVEVKDGLFKLETGQVLHFNGALPASITAKVNSSVLLLEHSSLCSCRRVQ